MPADTIGSQRPLAGTSHSGPLACLKSTNLWGKPFCEPRSEYRQVFPLNIQRQLEETFTGHTPATSRLAVALPAVTSLVVHQVVQAYFFIWPGSPPSDKKHTPPQILDVGVWIA